MSSEERLNKPRKFDIPDVVQKCEAEKQAAYDDGFRKGYLNLGYLNTNMGDLHASFLQGFEAGEAERGRKPEKLP